jgi:hypothetical protein
MASDKGRRHPLFALDDQDLEFVLRMVLASGSLKELAKSYRVSYPTIRSRLNRLIERLRAILVGAPSDPMAGLLADLVERGELTARAARAVLDMHRQVSGHETEVDDV